MSMVTSDSNAYRRWRWMLLLLWGLVPSLVPATRVHAATGLQVRVSSLQVELGKPLLVEVTTREHRVSLTDLDLSGLADWFVVAEKETIVDKATGTQQLHLRLYPLAMGEAQIPVFHLDTLHSDAIPVTVTAAMDPKATAPIRVETQVSTETPWQREQVLLRMDIIAPAAILKLRSEPGQLHGIRLVALQHTATPVEIAGRALTRHTLRWALFAETAGHRQLRLPPVAYVRDGVTTHRFYFPALDLQVRPLPVYVPPTMPVGQLAVLAPPLPRLSFRGELMNWQVTVTGQGLPATWLPDISAPEATPGMTFYTARVQHREDENGDGLKGSAVFRIPLKFTASGLLRSPELVVQYFDPRSATLRRLILPARQHVVIPRWLFYIMVVLALPSGYRFLRMLVAHLRARWRLLRRYRVILADIARARTPRDLRQCIAASCSAEGWPAGLSVRRWYARWKVFITSAPRLPLDIFYQELYAADRTTVNNQGRAFAELKTALTRLVRQRYRRLKWWW